MGGPLRGGRARDALLAPGRDAEAVLDPAAPPLAALATDGASVEGLRLPGGGLVLKVERGGVAVQVRLRDAGRLPGDAGISVMHPFGLRMPHAMRRMLDFWNVAGRSAPRDGRERRAGFATPARW